MLHKAASRGVSVTSPSGPAPRLLVVVAHPDDETFGTGSVLLHAAAAGAHTGVLCATRGEAGEVAPGVEPPAGGVAALREAELRAAADALGVAEVDLLAFTDSGMDGTAAPASLCGAPYPDVVAAVSAAVERFRPDVVVTLDASDGHRDHARIRDAVVEVVAPTDARLYLHCLPRSLMHEWVRHKAGVDGAAAYVDLPEIGTPDEQITTRLDTGALLDRRRRAIALHASQSSPFDGLPEDLARRFLGADHLIRVSPPWTGGEAETDIFGADAATGRPAEGAART
jgi:LmbE family N-acetylglucosaminyl deacetylase